MPVARRHAQAFALLGLAMVLAGVGLLGYTVPEIAWEKTRVAGERTRALVSLPQSDEVTPVVERALAEATEGRVLPHVVDPEVPGTEPPLTAAGAASITIVFSIRCGPLTR